MNTPQKIISLLVGSALVTASFLNAATTDPVGYVTVDINANADQDLGVPMLRAPSFSGVVNSIDGDSLVNLQSVPDLSAESHFVIFTNGAREGQWSEVIAATETSITLESGYASTVGINDSFKVIPFWTLDSLLPSGGGIPQSSNPSQPLGQVLFYDVNALGINKSSSDAFFYFEGATGFPEGWYTSAGAAAGSTIVSPETSIRIRNRTESQVKLVIAGTVPMFKISNTVLSRSDGRQDNFIFNPYPADMTLSESSLIEDGVIRPSSNPSVPTDILNVFPAGSNGLNPAASAAYFYFEGAPGFPAGWYTTGGASADSAVLEAGSAFVVRRGIGDDSLVNWKPAAPYISQN